jgi:Ca2+-transporting ATPase
VSQTSTDLNGLSQEEARARLSEEGANELPVAGQRNLPGITLEVVREPMFLLLVAAGAIYLLLGDVGDALMLLGFVCVVMGITIFQEYKTERVLQALRDLTSPRAQVLRDGMEQRIAGREVVRGDILLLSEGDRVPADAALITCNDFAADESLLTGESAAVRKLAQPDANQLQPPGGDDLPFVYSGTLVVQGRGTARVLATGPHSAIGKIGLALQELAIEATPLQLEIRKLVRKLAVIGVLLSLLLVAIYSLTRGNWMHGLLSGITLAMTLLPEEYPVILTVFMAMGAWRISRHRVLTRRAHTVEALGAATVLCVDKTGTLTLNRMTVQQLMLPPLPPCRGRDGMGVEQRRNSVSTPSPTLPLQGGENASSSFVTDATSTPLPEAFHALVEFGILASETDPFDPMEKAIHELGARYLADTEHIHRDWVLAHEYALSPQLLALSHVWRARDRDEYVVAAKGAPEAVADLCHLDAAQMAALDAQINTLAAQGMRVLGVARAKYSGKEWPDIQHDFDFEFLGLIGLADPVRPTVGTALKECTAAGIRVVMITGDYPATASAIARQIGLHEGSGGIINGAELKLMDDQTLRERIRHSNIFARMVPEQKLRLVNALKANGEIVAMTGDGVNDAPALKAAHIGIAMGGHGTDVAREAAALVLLDDDFASIVRAVRIGRGIFDNLRKAMAYIFAVHIPIAGLSLIPLLLGWPPVFAPVHIVFMEMIINPACSIAFEAEPAERHIMQRPPRDPHEPLFGKHTLPFSTLVFGNLGLILVNRSWQHSMLSTFNNRNPALWWVVGGALTFLLLALYLPFMRDLFHFAPITLWQLGLGCAAGLCSVLWFEFFKHMRRR